MRGSACAVLSVLMALAAGWDASSAAGGEAEEARQVFERTADDVGRPYVVGRTYLEQQGRAILPLLKEKAKAAEHRQRDLARTLLLRIESPERAAALYRGIDAWETRLLLDKPGVARVELAQSVEYYTTRKTEPPVPPEGVTYDRTATPLLIDYLRATFDHSGSGGPERGRPRAVAILDHLADPDAAPGLVDALGYSWGPQAKAIEDALVKLGRAALPALRRALADAPDQASEGTQRRASARMADDGPFGRGRARAGAARRPRERAAAGREAQAERVSAATDGTGPGARLAARPAGRAGRVRSVARRVPQRLVPQEGKTWRSTARSARRCCNSGRPRKNT